MTFDPLPGLLWVDPKSNEFVNTLKRVGSVRDILQFRYTNTP